MEKTKIAVLIDWFLPGTKAGGPVRSVYSLVQLLKDQYDFYILTRNTDLGSDTPYEGVKPDEIFIYEGVFYYYFSSSPSSVTLQKVLHQIDPHLVYLNSFWSYPFSILPLRLKKRNHIKAPVLLAPRGMLGQGAMGLKSGKKMLFLRLAKMGGLYKRLVFHATNEQEKADILKRLPRAKVNVVPNLNATLPAENKSRKEENVLSLFYLSRISRVKNLHFALEVLQKLPAGVKVSYDIYGNIEDASYWAECKRLIAGLPPHVQVSYKGEIPFHLIRETAVNYNALFLPTLNENFGHSIVESLLCGCVVVISDQTPWNEVNAIGGYALPLGDLDAFVRAIESLARLPMAALHERSRASVDFISKKTDLASVTSRYKTMFDECIKNRPLHL